MIDNIVHITAKDSSIIDSKAFSFDLIAPIETAFNKGNSVFYIEKDSKNKEPIINYYEGKWWAGRYVGEAIFQHKGQWYKFTIVPRFGEVFLFHLLEEIFNIQFVNSHHHLIDAPNQQNFIKRIIAQIWIHQLAVANRYGLPRHTIKKQQQGAKILGKLEVRKSILPLYTQQQVVSSFFEKELNRPIANILFQAYEILRNDYGLPPHLPSNAEDAIQHLVQNKHRIRKASSEIGQAFSLKAVYKSFKSVIELSLDIIRNKQKQNTPSLNQSDGYALFLDMAEIWEIYLKNILQKHFSLDGWEVSSPKITTYKDKIFKRTLIPDIVLKRENKTIVFDAKYKLMLLRSKDIDRLDFFQIHTYMAYYEQHSDLLFGGLLYPFMKVNSDKSNTIARSLINDSHQQIRFLIDGIDLSGLSLFNNEERQRVYFLEQKMLFLERVSMLF